ncbi:MAG: hypothetical protein M9949_06685 [Candidatus Kapabacteria bacterium]|nr:hypothetical protein [Candidatus Kapabacteria bacterium]
MRLLILLFLLLLVVTATKAAIRTVSNNPNVPAQYDNLQTAINDSDVGDTVYVSWSLTSYGHISLPKRLVIIGDGYNQGLAGRSATLDDLTLSQVDDDNNCSESVIQGLSINRLLIGIPTTGKSIEDLYILRIRIRNATYFYSLGGAIHKLHTDWYFKDCIFESTVFFASNAANRFVGAEDMIFSNCAFLNQLQYMGNPAAFINSLFSDFWKSTDMFIGVENALFTSCIFLSPPRGLENSTFNNCLTYSSGNNTIPYGTNTGENNIIDENPLFVSLPVKTAGAFNFATHNLNLQSGSPAIGSGLDGVDMGVYGGENPIPDFSGEPSIPLITSMTILNSVVGQDGSLRFKINAKNNK